MSGIGFAFFDPTPKAVLAPHQAVSRHNPCWWPCQNSQANPQCQPSWWRSSGSSTSPRCSQSFPVRYSPDGLAMFVSHTREDELLELLAEILFVITYSHKALLDDVGHKHDVFVRLSTLIVWERGKCYMQNEDIFWFLMRIVKKWLTSQHWN